MLFNSLQFLVFFPIVTALYFLIPHRFRWIHLLLASCVFYCAFIPVYIFILIFTIVIDYVAGIYIENAEGKKRKLFLTMSIIANVGILIVFKYFNFFIENMNMLLDLFNIQTSPLPLLHIILPVGLSFHTFQAMSYTIEVYKGNQKAEKHFGIYSLYVLFYPQLVAGPIERPQNLINQFKEYHPFNSKNLMNGFRLMLWGFFKKVVIADRIAIYVNSIYDDQHNYGAVNLILAAVFFAIQIYCDFSGYSDIAIGAAKTMGFNLMINFNRPYFAQNIHEHWSKWHISLTTWFRDYIYIPLGGSRISLGKYYLNIAVVFLISGFWHGANWTYIIWGGMHAVYTIIFLIYREYSPIKIPAGKITSFLCILFTFCLVALTDVFFRSQSIADIFEMYKNIITFNNDIPFRAVVTNKNLMQFGPTSTALSFIMIAIMFIIEKYTTPDLLTLEDKKYLDILFCSVILTLIIIFGVFHETNFIYFQF